MKNRFLLRASLTVEAALLAPILLSSVLMLLYLTAHVHNRCCLYASAAEQAVSGHEQEDPSLFAMAELSCKREDSEKERRILYEAGTLYVDGERVWSIREEAAYEKYRPAMRLRQIDAARELVGADAQQDGG